MNQPVVWSVDESRRVQLEQVAAKLNLRSYPEVMNMAIDEFIVRHSEVKPLRPEPPAETAKDKSIRKRIEEWATDLQTTPQLVRHDILTRDTDELQNKYGLHPSVVPDYRKYIQRQNS